MTAILHNKVFVNISSAAATASPWIPVDYRANVPQPLRAIYGTRANVSDTFQVLVRTKAFNPVTSATVFVTATATVFGSGPALFSVDLISPFNDVKVVKQGTGGAATVVGIV